MRQVHGILSPGERGSHLRALGQFWVGETWNPSGGHFGWYFIDNYQDNQIFPR